MTSNRDNTCKLNAKSLQDTHNERLIVKPYAKIGLRVSQSFNVPCGSVATILRLCFVAQFNWEQSSAVLLPQLQLFSCTRETSVAEFFSPSEKYSDLHAIATISTTKLVHTTQFSIIMQAY